MVEQNQVWVGSEDSVIYIINIHSMSCNKQLSDHRTSVTGLVVQGGTAAPRYHGASGRPAMVPRGKGSGWLRAIGCGARLGLLREARLGGGQVAFLSVLVLGAEKHGQRQLACGLSWFRVVWLWSWRTDAARSVPSSRGVLSVSPSVQMSPSYQDASPTGLGSTLLIPF